MTSLYLLAEDNNSSWIMLVVLAVLLVGTMLLSIIPQKKRQKKAQEMMAGIKVGTKIKTIGGFVGVIKMIDNAQGAFVIDISANGDGSVLVTIDKGAVYTVINPADAAQDANADASAQNGQESAPAAPVQSGPVAADDIEADVQAAEKKAAKSKKKKAKVSKEEDSAEESKSFDGEEAASADESVSSDQTGIDGDYKDLKF